MNFFLFFNAPTTLQGYSSNHLRVASYIGYRVLRRVTTYFWGHVDGKLYNTVPSLHINQGTIDIMLQVIILYFAVNRLFGFSKVIMKKNKTLI